MLHCVGVKSEVEKWTERDSVVSSRAVMNSRDYDSLNKLQMSKRNVHEQLPNSV